MTIVENVSGRINDVDSHEMTPAKFWVEEFGDVMQPIAEVFMQQDPNGPDSFAFPVEKDDAEITYDNVWKMKGAAAPGAFDMNRRLEVLDFLGIDRALIFPSGPGLIGLMLATSPSELLQSTLGLTADWDTKEAGEAMCRAHNDWCARTTKLDPRLRAVGALVTNTLEESVAEAERMVDAGVKAIMVPTGIPPAGLSPGHPELDALWRVFTEADIPVLVHVGGEFGFMASTKWNNAPDFEANTSSNIELGLDPHTLSVMHMASQNYLTAMVLGGVFERNPTLRMGVIEVTAHWIGPMAENLEIWANQFARRLRKLSMRPTEYIERNVRVSAFGWEPVDKYIDRFGLEDVYCYSSDFPHFESGPDSIKGFSEQLKRFGPELLEKFFVTNSQLLLP